MGVLKMVLCYMALHAGLCVAIAAKRGQGIHWVNIMALCAPLTALLYLWGVLP